MALQGFKILTFTNIQPGATAHGWWNNANSEVYRLNAWPNVLPGVAASAEITKISGVVRPTDNKNISALPGPREEEYDPSPGQRRIPPGQAMRAYRSRN